MSCEPGIRKQPKGSKCKGMIDTEIHSAFILARMSLEEHTELAPKLCIGAGGFPVLCRIAYYL